jgi:WD40 repeat protein/serine/threonine protein kinase
VLLTRLADEFAERYRRGERPSLAEYVERYPSLAADIREAFPALVEVEQVKEDHQEAAEQAGPPTPALQQLGDFRILREVGKGGMGVVYEAEQVSLGRHVALKVLPRNLLLDAKAKHRFQREAKAAAKLHHTNIVPVFGVGEQDGLPYYVMQFIQGLGLDEVLEELKKLQLGNAQTGSFPAGEPRVSQKGLSAVHVARSLLTGEPPWVSDNNEEEAAAPEEAAPKEEQGAGACRSPALSDSFTPSSSSVVLPGRRREGSKSRHGKPTYWQSVASIGAQVAEALEYAHKQGVLHRDVKPSNLLLDTQGTVWVTDFGLAKADDQPDLTHTGDILGTLRYMPPEAFEGKTDARSDVYSLGLTLYELLALRPAFEEKDRKRLIKRVTQEEPARLRKLNRDVPRDLETIVHKAIDREPAHRYPTARELAADLERFIDDEPIRARRASLPERTARWCRHNPALASLTAALLLVFGASFAAVTTLWLLADQRRVEAKRERDATNQQSQQAVNHLYHALVGEAHALRLARADSYRPQVWKRLRRALELQTPERDVDRLRQEAVACLGDFVGLEPTTWDDFPANIFALAAHPDGKQVAVGLKDGTLVLRSLSTGKETARLEEHSGPVDRIAFSPDGTWLVSLSGQTVRLWRSKADGGWGPVQAKAPGSAILVSVAFSRDGKPLAVCRAKAGEVMELSLWDLTDGTRTGRFQGPKGQWIGGGALSPDGGLLAVVAGGDRILVWDVVRQELKHEVALRLFSSARYVRFSGDGRLLLCNHIDGFVVYDTADFQRTFALRTDENFAHTFSPKGALLAVASPYGGSVRLFNLANHRQEEVAVLRAPVDETGRVVFSGDGRKLIVAAGRSMRVWDLGGSGEKVLTAGHDAGINSLAFSPNGKLLASCGRGSSVRLWDAVTGQPVKTFAVSASSFMKFLAFSPDGQQLAVGDGADFRCWDVASGKKAAQPRGLGVSAVRGVAFSPDGRRFAAGGWAGLTIWRVRRKPGKTDGGPQLTLEAESQVAKGFIRALCFSPDGGKLAWVGGDYKVRLWDIPNSRPLPFPPANPAGALPIIAFQPNGHLVLVSPAQEAEVWDVVAGQKASTFGKGRLPPRGQFVRTKTALSADGHRFAWQGGGVTVWDMHSRKLLAALPEDDSKVWALALSPDGHRLAVGLSDGSLAIWHLARVQNHLADLGLGW